MVGTQQVSRRSIGSNSNDAVFATRLDWLAQGHNAALLRGGLRGIEKESLRIDSSGQLSCDKHPLAWGAALTHPYLTTDYSEALPEFVTPPLRSNWETLQFLCDLHTFAHRCLNEELLWPASMPCVLDSNAAIPIAYYGSSNLGLMKTIYRRGLGYRYGRPMQAIAGVHFNYSPPSIFWDAYRDAERRSDPAEQFRSAQFMAVVRNYRRFSWLVTYLFGASPAMCKSFRPDGHELLEELDPATWYAPFATSLRMSDFGYRNKTQGRLRIGANSLDEYVAGLKAACTTIEPRYQEIGVFVDGEYRQLNANILQIENEYYSAIRPKPSKSRDLRPIAGLRMGGVDYVEVRTLDLSPTDPTGINQSQLRFLEMLLLYCLLADSPPIDLAEQQEIEHRDLTVAREGRRRGIKLVAAGRERVLSELGLEYVEQLRALAELLDVNGEGYAAAVDAARGALLEPERTPSALLLRDLEAEQASFFEHAFGLARDHAEYFRALALDPEVERGLEDVARRSLEEAARLEREQTQSFEEYLAAYGAAL